MQIGFLDFLCFFPIILSIFFGFGSGLIKLLIGFSFFLTSLCLTYFIYPHIGETLSDYIVSESAINLISIGAAYALSAIFCTLISKLIKKMAGDVSGGFIDRFFGAVLGAFRGFIIALGIFLIVTLFISRSTKESENMYELITIDKTKEGEYPAWVTSSYTYREGPELIKNLVEFIGKDNLQEVTFPDFKEKEEEK
jgi:uncharacterized membrane protein required for colicin V production